jgi:hypothetical protein
MKLSLRIPPWLCLAPNRLAGLYENIRLLCLQIVPARSGVDRSLKRLLALAELPPRLPGNRAFIAYWPPAENTNQLKLAVKDNIDVRAW